MHWNWLQKMAEMLKKEIKVSNSKKQIEEIFALCIGTPNGDIDLIGGLIFKSKALTGELESGKHKGTYMNLYTSEGENVEISD